MKKILKNTWFLLPCLLISTLSGAQTADEIIDKQVAVLGGKERFAKLTSSKIEATMAISGFDISSTTYILQETGFRTEQRVQGMTIVQAFDGKTAWTINPMTGKNEPMKLPAEINNTMSIQIDLTGLYDYKRKQYKVEKLADDTVEGAPVYVLRVTLPDGNVMTHYISKSTYYTLKTSIRARMKEKEMQSNIYLSNYKEVNGYVSPFTIEIEGDEMPGRITSNIQSIAYNVPIDPKIFAFPEK